MLDYLSDVGGLFDALAVIGNMIVAPFAAHALRNQLKSLVETDRSGADHEDILLQASVEEAHLLNQGGTDSQ
eukprot:CAMPEP_0185571884 /NCGR_PEP_ID=MMETSP0434-20130131/3888_1 /TAXON_ID=626734 ORGANISM="Favella taraikaensis, Strain Fe Narragansett Bay" /NCGR_SAMPLE_ID=MMETSP0434 /ASSEMBLY_ACC=CAM_ASM_000379 /LENGTH=71 /DNA_ID=CAMNT_0028187515 /DNA_START=1000 /DNA_END=1215 /DNA_ORIENTATION=+